MEEKEKKIKIVEKKMSLNDSDMWPELRIGIRIIFPEIKDKNRIWDLFDKFVNDLVGIERAKDAR